MRVLQDVTDPFAGQLVVSQVWNPAVGDELRGHLFARGLLHVLGEDPAHHGCFFFDDLHVGAVSGVGVTVQVEAVRFAFFEAFPKASLDVLADLLRFCLRERRQQGEHEFSVSAG